MSVVSVLVIAALVATLALFARQALLIAYILIGAVLGPWSTPEVVTEIADAQADDDDPTFTTPKRNVDTGDLEEGS